MKPHGRHIKVLGKGSPALMRDVTGLEQFLLDLVARLGMRPLGKPHIYEVVEEIEKLGSEPFEDEGGTTGIVVLSTSHCAIHTWPLRSEFVIDVYSCRDFDTAVVTAALEEHFDAHHMNMTDLSHSLVHLTDSTAMVSPQPSA